MANSKFINDLFNSAFLGCFIEEEKLLSSRIFSVALEEVRRLSENADFEGDDDDEDTSFDQKIEATKENLKEIIRLLKEADKAKNKFEKRFPKWSPLRSDNVKKLRELVSIINTERRNCNISRITSSSVSILGGAAMATSLIFPPAALLLAVGGGITAAVGGATVFGTSVTEIVLLKQHIEEAQEVLKKEEEDFKLVSEWFKHSQELIDLFEKILGFSVAKKVFEGLKEIQEDLKNLKSLKDGEIHSKLKSLIQVCVGAIAHNQIARTCNQLMFLIPIAITFFFVVVLLRKHNNLIFDSIVMSHRVVLGLLKLFDLGSDLGMLVCNAALRSAGIAATEVSTATARMVAHGVFAGIGVALDVTNLVFASIDVHNGSISPHAVQIESAAEQLEKEHEVLESVYNELFKKSE